LVSVKLSCSLDCNEVPVLLAPTFLQSTDKLMQPLPTRGRSSLGKIWGRRSQQLFSIYTICLSSGQDCKSNSAASDWTLRWGCRILYLGHFQSKMIKCENCSCHGTTWSGTVTARSTIPDALLCARLRRVMTPLTKPDKPLEVISSTESGVSIV
jgi:hypothetical protein